jgi:hypothetical protein
MSGQALQSSGEPSMGLIILVRFIKHFTKQPRTFGVGILQFDEALELFHVKKRLWCILVSF